jgi:hypothetical protein
MFLLLLFINFINLKKYIQENKLYPNWVKKNNGLIECKMNSDCPFPSECCNDPFFPVNYCCFNRELKYAYNYNYVKNN